MLTAWLKACVHAVRSMRGRGRPRTHEETSMTGQHGVDAVWNEWIGAGDWPQRACAQVGLAPDSLVEITLMAAGP